MLSPAHLVYAIIAVAVLAFLSGRIRLDLTAGGVIIALALSGILTPAQAVAGFGDPLVILIAGLFVIGEALHRTGVAAWVGLRIADLGQASEARLVVLLMPVVALLSAFMSSTGVVAIFIPVVLSIARATGLAPNRLLLPLAFASLIGGMLTLIGTPPNLAVSRALVDAGLPGFGFFDFGAIGGVILIAGIAYMLTLGRRLLPPAPETEDSRPHRSLGEMASAYGVRECLHRVRVASGSPLVDHTVGEMAIRRAHGITVIAVERRGSLLTALAPVLVDTRMRVGDVLIVEAPPETLERAATTLGLTRLGFPHGLQRRLSGEFGLGEALIVPDSPLAGKTVREANVRTRQGLTVLAARRGGSLLELDFQATRLQAGDLLLLAGSWDALERLSANRRDMILLELPDEASQRSRHAARAPWAVAITLAMLVLMTTQATSNLVAVMLAAFAMVVAGCVRVDEAYRAMNWQSLVLIAGMLPLADALEVTGATRQIVDALLGLVQGMGPAAMLAGVFLLTSLLSQFISNTATTVLLAPIALGLAQDLGHDPAPFLMTVAIAASTAFATPVASPVNTLILGPGEYRFVDFVRLGVPLQLIALMVTVVLVPLVFPL